MAMQFASSYQLVDVVKRLVGSNQQLEIEVSRLADGYKRTFTVNSDQRVRWFTLTLLVDGIASGGHAGRLQAAHF